MKRIKVILILALFLIVGGSYAIAQAQEDSDTQTSVVSLTIPHAAKLVIADADSSLVLDSDASAEAAFEDGYVEMPVAFPKLKVSANNGWQLSAQATTPFAAVSGYVKAVSDLKLKHDGLYVSNGFDSFKSLSASDQEIASHGAGVKNQWHNCQYRILLDYTKDVPGTYTATVTYTLSTNAS